MLNDPLSVTYDSVVESLARQSIGPDDSFYRTSDGEFEVTISDSVTTDGVTRREILLTRVIPDPTPADVFDNYRRLANSFGFVYEFDTLTRAETSVVIPLLRSALIAFVDSTLQGRIISGEK